ncbi:MAG: hypothetical protein FRX48_08989 [Lasallia pustulata]|uniref:Uncharacterized protein n=1 Tax=Lasallia pustulata TaxID=136370 RepID=A0A5M8PD02_9LECA|nr:MAG: hypothetical protein FRX48_08989 [Lasallia pustulata]
MVKHANPAPLQHNIPGKISVCSSAGTSSPSISQTLSITARAAFLAFSVMIVLLLSQSRNRADAESAPRCFLRERISLDRRLILGEDEMESGMLGLVLPVRAGFDVLGRSIYPEGVRHARGEGRGYVCAGDGPLKLSGQIISRIFSR